MNIKTISAAAIAIGVTAPAFAQTWQEAARAGSTTVYVDVSSVQREGNIVRFATQVRYNPPFVGKSVVYDHTIDRRRGDCVQMSDGLLHIRAFQGANPVSGQIEVNEAPKVLAPGSTGHAALALACRVSAASH